LHDLPGDAITAINDIKGPPTTMAFEGAARITRKGGPPVVPNNRILVRVACPAARPGPSADVRSAPAEIFSVSLRLSVIEPSVSKAAFYWITEFQATAAFVVGTPWHVRTWPIATNHASTANRRFRGIADMAGPASLPDTVAIGTREPQDGTVACPVPGSAQLFLISRPAALALIAAHGQGPERVPRF
jgi:hypothetical protein